MFVDHIIYISHVTEIGGGGGGGGVFDKEISSVIRPCTSYYILPIPSTVCMA